MKCLLLLCAPVLLLLTQTAGAMTEMITVTQLHESIELSCPENSKFNDKVTKLVLPYNDSNSGEYSCWTTGGQKISIYVKFRTCDNCIELDVASIAGMVTGDVLATCIIGVAVYLFASVIRSGPATSVNKRSNKQLPSSRGASNDPYQALRFNSPKDEYDHLGTKR